MHKAHIVVPLQNAHSLDVDCSNFSLLTRMSVRHLFQTLPACFCLHMFLCDLRTQSLLLPFSVSKPVGVFMKISRSTGACVSANTKSSCFVCQLLMAERINNVLIEFHDANGACVLS